MTDFIQITAISQNPDLADKTFILRKSDIKNISFPLESGQEPVVVELPDLLIEVRETLSYFQNVLNVYSPSDVH